MLACFPAPEKGKSEATGAVTGPERHEKQVLESLTSMF